MTGLDSIIDKITDSVDERIFIIDKAHNILFASQSLAQFFNCTKSSILGRQCHEFISADLMHCHNQSEFSYTHPFNSVFETGIASTATRFYIDYDGNKKCFQIIASPIIGENININQVMVMFKDVTENGTVSESISKQQSFLSSVLNGIRDGVIVVNRDLKIISANKGYCSQVNMTENEVSGRHCYEVYHNLRNPCYMKGEDCAVKKSFKSGMPQTSIHTHTNKSGESRIVKTKAYPIKDESGQTVSAVEIISDVTERFKLQKELQQKIKELQEFYDLAVGRELKMVELKEEIDSLRQRINHQQPGEAK
jgi:PAS domain S-box-containing protein